MTAAAPLELAQLGLDREHFVRSDSKSWRGPCFRCGGHRRFVIWTDKPFPKWNWECSQCGAKGFADQLNTALRQPVPDDVRREWAERNARDRAERERRRLARLLEYTADELWTAYHARLAAEHRAQWRAWGVPDEWQDHLQLGYVADKPYRGEDGELHHSAAFTLPYFHYGTAGFDFQAMQYRLFSPPTPTDRYRWEAGMSSTYYMAEPGQPIGDCVLITEGAKKAIVTHVYGGLQNVTVLAVPSKSDFGGVAEAVRECGRVIVLLDPDAALRTHRLAADIGPAARVAELPGKVDDLLTGGASSATIAAAVRWAQPVVLKRS